MGAASKVHCLVSTRSVWALGRHGDDALKKPDWANAKGRLSGLTSRTAVYVIRMCGGVGGPSP